MSRENLEAVRRSIEAVNAGGLDAMLSDLATDAEWRVAEEHPESRTCRATKRIRSYFAQWRTQLDHLRFELAELVERGDRVIASGYVRGTGAGSGVEIQVPLAIVFTWRGGKIIRGEEYLDTDRAREAVGSLRNTVSRVIEVLDTDITKLEVDAIANAANTRLLHGGGVAGAISRAGGPEVQAESHEKAPIGLGEAVETTAGDDARQMGDPRRDDGAGRPDVG